MAGGAAGVLPVSLSCPLPLRRTHAVVCTFRVFAEIGVISTKSGRLEVNLSLSEKRSYINFPVPLYQLSSRAGTILF